MQARAPTTPKGGRSSAQAIESGDGYVEFTAALSTGDVYCGLSRGDSTQSYDDIDFAIYASAHNARAVYVVEGGVVKGAYGTFAAGDRFRVAVEGGVVKYYRVAGGALTLLRASAAAPRYPLVADTALYGAGDRLDDVVVGGGVGAAADVRWLVSDHLGTPRMVVDETGSLAGVKRHDYFPFGEEIGAGVGGRTTNQGYSQFDGVRQGFTGYEKDVETGLNFAQARYHSPMMGRFTSPDKTFADQFESAPQSWNLYSYVQNNPLKYIDPRGEAHWETCGDGQQCWVGDEDGEYDKDLHAYWVADGQYWKFLEDNGLDHNVYEDIYAELNGPKGKEYLDDWQRGGGLGPIRGGIGPSGAARGARGGFRGAARSIMRGIRNLFGKGSAKGAFLNRLSGKDAEIFKRAAEKAASRSGSFQDDLYALTEATVETIPGARVSRLGSYNGAGVFGSGKSGVGIADINGVTTVVKKTGEGFEVLGEFK